MSRPPLHLDLETRSVIDLRKVGAHEYAKHPTTDVILGAWAFGDDEPVDWFPSQPCPPEIVEHVKAGGQVRAYNAAFERLMWRNILTPRYGWPEIELSQFYCVMAKSYALSLPGDLEGCASALGITDGKDMAGARLMMSMCKPRRIEADGNIVWWDDEERIKRLSAYCRKDVATEQEVDRRMVDLRPHEFEIFLLDQKINDTGVYIDRDLCAQALKVVEQAAKSLNDKMADATSWVVTACTQNGRLLEWVRSQGVEVASLAKASLAELLARKDLPADVREVLELRKDAAKSSTAKIHQFLARSEHDGWMRGLLQYHGAGTGRWCLAEGTKVCVRTAQGIVTERPIEDVRADDLLWDGNEWVTHDGVVFSGDKDVITWDGITATPEHIVYLSDSDAVPLGEARRRRVPLWRGNSIAAKAAVREKDARECA